MASFDGMRWHAGHGGGGGAEAGAGEEKGRGVRRLSRLPTCADVGSALPETQVDGPSDDVNPPGRRPKRPRIGERPPGSLARASRLGTGENRNWLWGSSSTPLAVVAHQPSSRGYVGGQH